MKHPRKRRLTSREWLSLGVLAVNAATDADINGNTVAKDYYLKLARECDLEAVLEDTRPKAC